MAGSIKTNSVQLGDSATATQNFVLQTNVDGTAKLSRGNVGATTQDILTVNAGGVLSNLLMPMVGASPIVESGSNTNGIFIKWADGTMICNRTVDLPGVALNTGSVAEGDWAAFFFQIPFLILSPFGEIGDGSAAKLGLVNMNGYYGNPTATKVIILSYTYRYATNLNSNLVRFAALGIGRWKA